MPPEPEFAYVSGFPGYACTKGGRVFSCRGGKIRPRGWHPIKPAMGTGWLEGWWAVTIYVGERGAARKKAMSVAHLIALAWIGPKPEGHCVAFKDKDRSNLHADNLCWMPTLKAMGHYQKRGESHAAAKLTADQVTAARREVADAVGRGEKPNFGAIGARYGCTVQHVQALAKRVSWKHLEDGVPAWVPGPRGCLVGDEYRKLTEPDVIRIKQRLQRGERICDIARDYADTVCRGTIDAIAQGKSWAYIKV